MLFRGENNNIADGPMPIANSPGDDVGVTHWGDWVTPVDEVRSFLLCVKIQQAGCQIERTLQ